MGARERQLPYLSFLIFARLEKGSKAARAAISRISDIILFPLWVRSSFGKKRKTHIYFLIKDDPGRRPSGAVFFISRYLGF